MAISNFFVKKIQKLNELYVIFCKTTNLPYIECDSETFDDQIFVFTDEEKAKAMVDEYKEKKQMAFAVMKLTNKLIMPFMATLFAYGVNCILFTDQERARIQVEELVKKPDIQKLKDDKIPRINPETQLSAAYFLQEVRRRDVKRSQEEMLEIRQLEEEMAANFFRSRFIVAIEPTADPAAVKNSKNIKLLFVKLPNGDSYIPSFTDFAEFQKFAAKNKGMNFNLIAVPFDGLEKFTVQTKGIVINPAGFNLVMPNDLMKKLKANYGK